MTILYNTTTQEILSFHSNGYWVDGKKPELPENILELEVVYSSKPLVGAEQKTIESWTVNTDQKTYVQNLYVVNKNAEEIEADRVASIPKVINRRQIKHGMIQLLGINPSAIDGLIAEIEDENQRNIAQIFWEDSVTIEIDHPVLLGFANQIGLTQRQLEDFFIKANKL